MEGHSWCADKSPPFEYSLLMISSTRSFIFILLASRDQSNFELDDLSQYSDDIYGQISKTCFFLAPISHVQCTQCKHHVPDPEERKLWFKLLTAPNSNYA